MRDENERVDAILVKIWDNKIDILKLVRELTGLGLAEARDFIENLPRTVKENLSYEEGKALRTRFSQIGASLDLQPSSRT